MKEYFLANIIYFGGFPGGTAIKNQPANLRDKGDVGSIPGLGWSSGIGNGNPFQYSYLESFMDRGARWAIVHGVAKSQMQLSACAHTHTYFFVSWPYWTLTYVIFCTQDYEWPEMILNLRNLQEDEWGEKTHKGHHLHNPSLIPAEISSTQGFHAWKIAPHLTVAHSTERFQQKDKVFEC